MLLDEFLTYIKVQRRYSPRTYSLYREAISEFYIYMYPEKGVEQSLLLTDDEALDVLTSTNLRGFIALGLESGLNSRTLNLKLSALSSYCNYLVKLSMLPSNPVRKVYRPKESKKIPQFYTEGALTKYLQGGGVKNEEDSDTDKFHCYRNRMIILILYATGMRRSELVSLKEGDFDSSRRVFRIVGKGDKPREIPITISVCKEISLYLERIKNEFPNRDNGSFFVTDEGKPIYPQFVNNIVKEELSGVEGFSGRKSPHVLRHSLATHLLNNGADLNCIKEILGHSSLAATQVYTHNSFEQLKKTYLTAHPRAKNGGKNGN